MTLTDVVIVTRNHAQTLASTLAGLELQGDALGRVALVDNASVDGSVSLARRWSPRLPLEVIEHPVNRGFSAAANDGLRTGSSPWVLSLNPDCRLEGGFLRALIGQAEERGAGHASGLLLRGLGPELASSAVVDSAGMVVSPAGRHYDRGAGRPLQDDWLRPAWVFGATGACSLYRREALADVAYHPDEVFDEGFFAYREDADLAWRLQRRGWRCLYWPAARAAHQRGLRPEAHRRGSLEINRLSVRNRFLLRWSNADDAWLRSCFPHWWLRDLLVVTACLTVERSSWGGVREAWRMRPAQRRRGAENARRARVPAREVNAWFRLGGRVEALG